MPITIKESHKYDISGKIIDINGSTFTISVTFPFTHEIKFYCRSRDYNALHPPVSSKYNWIRWVEGDGPPNISEASAYYNTEDKCFYKKESGRASEWEAIDFEDLYDDDPLLFTEDPNIIQEKKYWFFQDRYMSILQKEQLCNFSAYVIRKEDLRSVHSQEVERYPDDYDYFWIYDPDSFSAEKWDAESIDDLVKEIRPSRDCLEQLLKSYEDDDRDAKRERWDRRWKKIKSTPKRVEDFMGKYSRLLWFIITFGMFLVGIGSLIVAYLTYSKD